MEADSPIQLTSSQIGRFRRRLLAWFRQHRRDLPWRKSRDPYRVWISEIMLQQTQVATVRAYFTRFLAAFPTVDHLASAAEEEVLRQWEGLGYYRRARQMHAAAKQIVSACEGTFPHAAKPLERLPGIGRYTAAAIASIAFDEPAPIVEANTSRLYARLAAISGPLTTAANQRLLWDVAGSLLPRRAPGEFNQALMELGSLVCTPDAPRCAECPVMHWCEAHSTGLVDSIPQKAVRQSTIRLHETAVVVARRGRVLLRRCKEDERWAGLWDFPRFSVEGNQSGSSTSSTKNRSRGKTCESTEISPRLARQFLDETGITVRPHTKLKTLRHSVTRYSITLDCIAAEYVGGQTTGCRKTFLRWVPRRELDRYPLSSTGRKIAQLIAL